MHRQAWDLALTAAIVQKHAPSQYWAFGTYVFDNQDQIYSSAFYNKTEADLYDWCADVVAKFGIARSTYMEEMQADDIFAMADASKHLGIIHQAYGTPTFLINGFKAEMLGPQSTLTDWRNVLDPLLS